MSNNEGSPVKPEREEFRKQLLEYIKVSQALARLKEKRAEIEKDIEALGSDCVALRRAIIEASRASNIKAFAHHTYLGVVVLDLREVGPPYANLGLLTTMPSLEEIFHTQDHDLPEDFVDDDPDGDVFPAPRPLTSEDEYLEAQGRG
jgi:hypothetical protein